MKKIDCDGNYCGSNIYHCWNETYQPSECDDCTHNRGSDAEVKTDKYVTYAQKVDVLYQYLMGKSLPDGVTCPMPKLSPNKAFDVIWFLQEIIRCLPDTIEQCQTCKCLFDSDSEGCRLDDQHGLIDDDGNETGKTIPKKYWGHYCEECIPVEFYVK